jgi:uncharacterized protein with beta-barrel porin domain
MQLSHIAFMLPAGIVGVTKVNVRFLSDASRLALVFSAASLSLSCPALAASFSVPPDSATTAKTVANNDTGFVGAGNTLSVTGTAISWTTGLASPGVVITNNGTISATSRGIDTPNSAISGNFTLNNNAGAMLTSANDAFRIQNNLTSGTVTVDNFGTIQSTATGRVFDFNAVTSNAAIFSITNEAGGTLKAVGNDAMRVGAGTTTITNSGLIDATTLAGSRAIRVNTNLNSVTSLSIVNNAGATIQSADDALQINGSGTSNATTTASFSVDNAGTIRSATGQAIDFDNLSSTAATVTITNRATGLITADNADAVRPGQNFTIYNYGQIIANSAPVPADRPGADGIDLQAGHTGTVYNYAGGVISGAKSGTAGGLGSNITVINDVGATIIGRDGSGVGSGGNAVVTNYGTITGAIDATSARGDGDGIDVDFVLTLLTNYGTVQGTGAKGADDGGRLNNSEGVAAGGGTIRNYGTITGATAGIVINNDSNTNNSRSGSAALDLINYAGGSIVGQNSYAIRSENKTGTAIDNDTIVNYGSIVGNGTIPDPNGVTLLQNGNPDPGSVGTLNGVTYTGTGATRFIRGDGAAIQTGEGNDVLSNYGTITGNTGRAISMEGGDDTLNLYAGSSIAGRIDGGVGTDAINLFGAGSGTLANVINFETLNVQGGSWTVADAQSYQGGATVFTGATLLVNGALVNAVTVNAGGTLGGSGSVGNTFVNGGTLSPGNSIGTLTVQGSLVFTAASTYLVQVSGANADRTNVATTATLGGATVNAAFAGTSFLSRYTIVNATGGVSGTFGALVSNLPSTFNASLSYDAHNAYLDLALNFAPAAGLNGNQRNVGNALTNFFNATGSIPIVFGALTPAGLSQISGEVATGSQQTTFDAMGMFMGIMTDPFVAGRGDGVGGAAGAPAYAEQSDDVSAYAPKDKPRSAREREAYAAIWHTAPLADSFIQRWSIWAAGYGGSQTTDGNAALGSNAATSRIAGTAVGADYRFSPNTLAGFALAGGGTSFSVANALGSGRSDLFQAGAFLRHTIGPAYISVALAYGWQDITTDRTVTIAGVDQLRAKFNANAWSGRVETGYRFLTQGFGLTPYAAGQFVTFELPNYAEAAVAGANTFALAYAADTVTATRSELGLRSDKSFAMQGGILTLRGRAAWAHDFNPDRNIAATFQTLPGASFVVNGAAQASDAALVTGSAEMKWLNGISLAATFEGEFSDVTRSYAGKGVARYAW